MEDYNPMQAQIAAALCTRLAMTPHYAQRVINEEWDSYQRLLRFITSRENGQRGVAPVLLREVRNISRVAYLPTPWRLYVATDDTVTRVDRIRHIIGMLEEYDYFEYVRSKLGDDYLILHAEGEVSLAALFHISYPDERAFHLYHILRHNADLLRAYNREHESKHLPLSCSYARLLWGDIRQIAAKLEIRSLSHDLALNSFDLLNGCGTRLKKCIEVNVTLCPKSAKVDQELYYILSLSHSVLVGLINSGLSLVVVGKSDEERCTHSDITQVVQLTNLLPMRVSSVILEVALSLECNECTRGDIILPIEYFSLVVKELDRYMGESVLRWLLLLCRIHEPKYYGRERCRVSTFMRELATHLREAQT